MKFWIAIYLFIGLCFCVFAVVVVWPIWVETRKPEPGPLLVFTFLLGCVFFTFGWPYFLARLIKDLRGD